MNKDIIEINFNPNEFQKDQVESLKDKSNLSRNKSTAEKRWSEPQNFGLVPNWHGRKALARKEVVKSQTSLKSSESIFIGKCIKIF